MHSFLNQTITIGTALGLYLLAAIAFLFAAGSAHSPTHDDRLVKEKAKPVSGSKAQDSCRREGSEA